MVSWAQILKTRAWQSVLHRDLSRKLHFTGSLALNCLPPGWTACLHCVSAVWASPYKGVSGILFQLLGLRISPSNQSCTPLASQSRSILTNQDGAFWINQIVRVWSPHLQEDRSVRDLRGGDSCPYKPTSLWLGEHSSHWSLRTVSLTIAENIKGVLPEQCMADQRGTKQISAERSRAEQTIEEQNRAV